MCARQVEIVYRAGRESMATNLYCVSLASLWRGPPSSHHQCRSGLRRKADVRTAWMAAGLIGFYRPRTVSGLRDTVITWHLA
jgi:hypothetical protein